jgi:hypothetical protein
MLGFFAFGRAARHAFKIEQSAKLAPDWHPAALYVGKAAY